MSSLQQVRDELAKTIRKLEEEVAYKKKKLTTLDEALAFVKECTRTTPKATSLERRRKKCITNYDPFTLVQEIVHANGERGLMRNNLQELYECSNSYGMMKYWITNFSSVHSLCLNQWETKGEHTVYDRMFFDWLWAETSSQKSKDILGRLFIE